MYSYYEKRFIFDCFSRHSLSHRGCQQRWITTACTDSDWKICSNRWTTKFLGRQDPRSKFNDIEMKICLFVSVAINISITYSAQFVSTSEKNRRNSDRETQRKRILIYSHPFNSIGRWMKIFIGYFLIRMMCTSRWTSSSHHKSNKIKWYFYLHRMVWYGRDTGDRLVGWSM